VTPSDRAPSSPVDSPGVDSLPEAVVRTVVEASPDGLVIVASDGTIVYANSAVCEMFGWESSELTERPIEVLLRSEDHAAHRHHRHVYVESPTVRPMGQGTVSYTHLRAHET